MHLQKGLDMSTNESPRDGSLPSDASSRSQDASFLGGQGKPSPYPGAGLPPWHNLGTELVNSPTARQAVEAAELNYTVIKIPWKLIPEGGRSAGNSDPWAVLRTDTGAVLGIVGKHHELVQNRNAFAFFDHLVAAGEATYVAAGTFGRGERLWIMARLPGFINVQGNDIVARHLLLSHSHSGSPATQVKIAPLRVVCFNTLAAPLDDTGEAFVRHSAHSARDRKWADALLGSAIARYDQLDRTFNQMARTKISDRQLWDYVTELVPERGEEIDTAKNQAVRTACLESYETSQGAELSRGTLWSAFNCVADYTDHKMDGYPRGRLESLWFGEGEQLKLKAFHLAERMM
jgi:phage/plasmid-like protein (TIGR03299 family)